MPAKRGRTKEHRNSLKGPLTGKHKRALQLVAGGMTQKEAAIRVGLSPIWLNGIINSKEEAREYLEESRDRLTAKYRRLAEASVDEHLKAVFAEERKLTAEEKAKLSISREAAIQAGMSPTVVRAAGLIDEPGAQPPPPISLRLNVLAMLQDPVVAKLAQQAAHEAAARGILLAPQKDATT